MSKIGNLNLELQEQANELGYDTVQEALDNGYEVIQRTMGAPRDLDEVDREPEAWYELQKKDELKEAHEAWLKEREEVLEGLDIVVHSDAVPFEHKEIVKDAIEFIKRGEV